MKYLFAVIAICALGGCGVETMGAAATAAAIKKQELEQGKKTMDQTRQKIGQAMELQQQRAQQSSDSAEK
jgi:hypothetical protein